ncbi:MAG: gliding motility-associated C-terminal domain-containing protein [Saprospiraceae bacterium]|nr:gliding motility-associated C-terminal domain-containing protein [Saprospiraceae bacterium]
MKTLQLLPLLLLSFAVRPSFAQDIVLTYTNSNALYVCGTDTFFIQIRNNSTTSTGTGVLNLTLPTGLTYVAGSAAGLLEVNITDLAAPVFAVPDIAQGTVVPFHILLTANCDAAEALDDGRLFQIGAQYQSAAGSAGVLTAPLPVETGLLLITGIQDALMTGEKGDTLVRTIRVKNTRLGKIGRIFLQDDYQPGMFIFEVSGAGVQNLQAGRAEAQFDGGYIAQFGNGDPWLDLNEEMTVLEKIAIDDCGNPVVNNLSRIRLGWGCDVQRQCRYDSALATVQIRPYTRVPAIDIRGNLQLTKGGCGQSPARQEVLVINSGTGEGKNVLLQIALSESGRNGIVPGTFQLRTKGQTTSITPNLTTNTTFPDCGLSLAFSGATIIVPTVPAQDTVVLSFEVVTCADSCYVPRFFLLGNYFYQRLCPQENISKTFKITADTLLNRFSAAPLVDLNACLQSGQSYTYAFAVNSPQLLDDDGFLVIDLTLPRGLSLDTTCTGTLSISGQPAFRLTNLLQSDSSSLVQAAFKLPLPADTGRMLFCIRYDCLPDMPCTSPYPEMVPGVKVTLPIPVDTSCMDGICLLEAAYHAGIAPDLASLGCSFGICGVFPVYVNTDCLVLSDSSSSNPPELDGVVSWSFDTYRINTGFRDDDDDRAADALIPPTPALTRLDRYIPGDTMRVALRATVVDGNVTTLPRHIWHEVVQSDMQAPPEAFDVEDAQARFTNRSSIRWVGSNLLVEYADGATASCPLLDSFFAIDQLFFRFIPVNVLPTPPIDQLVTMRHTFVVYTTELYHQGCLPRPSLAPGDRVTVYTDFKIGVNYIPFTQIEPKPALVNFRTAVDLIPEYFAWNLHPFDSSEYSGYRLTREGNQMGIQPCTTSTTVRPFAAGIELARNNFFPFEVRPLMSIENHYLTTPPGLVPVDAQLFSLIFQDSTPARSAGPLPFEPLGDRMRMDFSSVFLPPLDEGFFLKAGFVMGSDCYFFRPDSSDQYTDYRFTGCLREPNLLSDTIQNAVGYLAGVPRIFVDTLNTDLLTSERYFAYTFDLRNIAAPQAKNVWLSAVAPSGLMSDFKLLDKASGQEIPFSNGVAQIGQMNSFSKLELQLSGLNSNCENDSLLLIYGFGCDPVTGLDDPGICAIDTLVLYVRLLNPELELDVLEEGAVDLCDTSEYYVFEVYNAKFGFAYDVQATVQLPPGISVLPGTAQISYPAGAPFVDLADPSVLPGNVYYWAIDSLPTPLGSAGLPGIDLAPAHTFRIRLRLTAACGAVSDAQPVFGATGREPCGRPANTLNKPGREININGLDANYAVFAGLSVPGGITCGEPFTVQVRLDVVGTPGGNDSIYILLPEGIGFLEYLPGVNAYPGGPDIFGDLVRLPLLTVAGTVAFDLVLLAQSDAPCLDPVLRVQARQVANAFCPTAGDTCNVYVATGEAVSVLTIARPQLSVAGSKATAGVNGQIGVSVTVKNDGTVAAGEVRAVIVLDQNGNGQPDAGEPVLGQTVTSGPLLPGGLSNLDVSVTASPADWCRLLVVLPGEGNCRCADVAAPLHLLETALQNIDSCHVVPIALGVDSLPGYAWSWLPTTGLGCVNCAQTIFTPAPGTPAGSTFLYSLLQTQGDCRITHTFELTLGFSARATAAAEAICRGSSTQLQAFPAGQTYAWAGPGILDPGSPQQTVAPDQTSTYTVRITSASGCTVLDTLLLTVNLPDSLSLPALSTCQGTPVNVNGFMTDSAGLYCRRLTNGAGCDSLICQTLTVLPTLATADMRPFCAGDTLTLFDTLLTETGTVCRTFTGVNGCDSIHCVTGTALPRPALADPDTFFIDYGTPITLTGPDGFQQYAWQPPDPACPGCQTLTVQPDTAGLYLFTLTVTDTNGCTAQSTYRVLMAPPCDPSRVNIPNAFTPDNGDGLNDVFRPVPSEGSEVISSLTIYSRWGEKVYEGSGPNAAWDGTVNGKPAPADVYVYILIVGCPDGTERFTGDVTLLR